jgi:AcrR family transcriptional regulator
MRSLAGALEVTATALYWHVSTKEDVLDLAFDHIFGARTEFLQSALSRGGLTDLRLAVTTHLLANHVIGAALTEATYRRTPATPRLDVRRHITADPAAFPTQRLRPPRRRPLELRRTVRTRPRRHSRHHAMKER